MTGLQHSDRYASVPTPAKGIARALWFVAGTVLLAVGIAGVAVPVLPTTPFLLLAAACYLRSSKKMHNWMTTNRIFGKYLKDYSEGRGISKRAKIWTVALLWAVIAVTAVLFTEETWLRALLVIVAVAVSVHIAAIRPKSRPSPDPPS